MTSKKYVETKKMDNSIRGVLNVLNFSMLDSLKTFLQAIGFTFAFLKEKGMFDEFANNLSEEERQSLIQTICVHRLVEIDLLKNDEDDEA